MRRRYCRIEEIVISTLYRHYAEYELKRIFLKGAFVAY